MKQKYRKRKMRGSYIGKGRIIDHYLAPRELYNYIWSQTEYLNFPDAPEEYIELREKCHRLLAHLYASMRLQIIKRDLSDEQRDYVPLYCRLREREFGRDFKREDLKLMEIIDIKPHNTAGHKAEEYKLKDEIFNEALRIEKADIFGKWEQMLKGKEIKGSTMVDLLTGKRKSSVVKSKYTKRQGAERDANTPKLIGRSISSLEPCPFNPKYIYNWVIRLQRKYNRERDRLNEIREKYGNEGKEFEFAEREFLRAQGKFHNELTSMRAILNQKPKRLPHNSDAGEPLYEYKAAYSVQTSGRISEVHGGFQSASRYFKRAFFREMRGWWINHDLQNSQVNILLQEMKACSIECPWLEAYLSDPEAKKKYARKVGVPVDVWKKCFYSIFMGASVENEFGAVFKQLRKHFVNDIEKTRNAHIRFLEITAELNTATEEWRNYVYSTKNRRYHYQYRGIKYWKNACKRHFHKYGIKTSDNGERILIDREKKDTEIKYTQGINKCKRKLAAFILQGREAFFIHNLTLLCSEYKIPVYKNEHDGLITGKEIPETIIQMAGEMSGLVNPVLKRKPICSKVTRRRMKQYVKS